MKAKHWLQIVERGDPRPEYSQRMFALRNAAASGGDVSVPPDLQAALDYQAARIAAGSDYEGEEAWGAWILAEAFLAGVSWVIRTQIANAQAAAAANPDGIEAQALSRILGDGASPAHAAPVEAPQPQPENPHA